MISRSPEETERFGERLAARLRPGDAVWLYGGLGTGKTAFTRGLARGLGVRGRVTSPTYAVANVYEDGQIPLAHYDAYRLAGFSELLDAGWDEYASGIRVAEWAERADGNVSGICVMLERTGGDEREICVCYLP